MKRKKNKGCDVISSRRIKRKEETQRQKEENNEGEGRRANKVKKLGEREREERA